MSRPLDPEPRGLRVNMPGLPAVITLPDRDSLGPAMRRLWVSKDGLEKVYYVIYLLESGTNTATAAAQAAAHAVGRQSSAVALETRGWRWRHHPDIQAAMYEETVRNLNAFAAMATKKLALIAFNDTHRDQYKAIVALLNRGGYQEKSEVKHTVEHHNPAELIREIVELAKSVGVDPRKLLGQAGVRVPEGIGGPDGAVGGAIDAEFAPVDTDAGANGSDVQKSGPLDDLGDLLK